MLLTLRRFISDKANFSKPMVNIQTYVFLDLETTGLPHLENNKTKITELSLVAVDENHLSLGVLPRVQSKLNLCFNPWKLISYESEKITGLSNNILEHLGSFSKKTVESINLFLTHHPKPICLVAHNGNKFDFPIFRTEIEKTGSNLIEDIYCIDSLETFRALHYEDEIKESEREIQSPPVDTVDSVPLELTDGFDEILCNVIDEYENSITIKKALEVQKINETTPKKRQIAIVNLDDTATVATSSINETMSKKHNLSSCPQGELINNKKLKTKISRRLDYGVSFKLSKIYERLTSMEPINAHRAENDVNMLMMCAVKLGERFTKWGNENAYKFDNVPPMTPGKKIGN